VNNIASWIWVLIPLAAIGIAPFRMWMRVKERQLELQSTMTAEKTAQYAAHTERLEARMRVLERIITDRGVDLADEIESLREKPLN
jgi:ABC-type phosphate transport system auxiliary subunit